MRTLHPQELLKNSAAKARSRLRRTRRAQPRSAATDETPLSAFASPHRASAAQVAASLGTDLNSGLSEQVVGDRSKREGPNVIPERPPVSSIVLAARQLGDSMVLLLLAAAVVSIVIGETLDAGIILTIVVLNAFFGAVQEGRAQMAARQVRALLEPRAVVIREGSPREVSAAGIVMGDLVVIAAGDRVPADGRIVECSEIEIDESLLTGESLPRSKRAEPPVPERTSLPERETMAYAGTLVSRGRGLLLATATGLRTEVARIARLAEQKRPRTPLQQRLDRLALNLLRGGAVICIVLTAVFAARGHGLVSSLLLGVSLAVAAIPEGLAAVVTITLTMGMRRLAARGAIVRRLVAVETLGSTSVICTDKTGTLTRNEMTLTHLLPSSDDDPEALARLLGGALLACDPASLNAEDAAIADAGAARGLTHGALLRDRDVVEHRPFEAERRRASTIVREGDQQVLYVKGAPDTLLPLLARPSEIARLGKACADWAAEGVRVLLVACRAGVAQGEDPEHDLEALGLLGLSDPLRESAPEAIAVAAGAGVRTLMVTGDEPRTAVAVARACGIGGMQPVVLAGKTMDELSDEQLDSRINEVDVFARIAPVQKLRIVRALQRTDEVVAMTGDGVNDVPALAAADAGMAMGRGGTAVAIDAADVVITDNDLSTIVAAISEGRAIYANIVRFVHFLLSANAGEIFLFALAVSTGASAPLLVAQILTVNLLTDGLPAVALGLDPADESVMREPPRPRRQRLFEGARGRLGLVAALTGGAAFAAFLIGSRTDTTTGRTMAFTTLVLAQLAYVFAVRTDAPFWRAPRNPVLILSTIASVVLLVAALALRPFRQALELGQLSVAQVILSVALALLPLLGAEGAKLRARRTSGTERESRSSS